MEGKARSSGKVPPKFRTRSKRSKGSDFLLGGAGPNQAPEPRVRCAGTTQGTGLWQRADLVPATSLDGDFISRFSSS